MKRGRATRKREPLAMMRATRERLLITMKELSKMRRVCMTSREEPFTTERVCYDDAGTRLMRRELLVVRERAIIRKEFFSTINRESVIIRREPYIRREECAVRTREP